MTTDPRLDWFVNARYGLFIHYGLYSLLGRGEWALNREQLDPAEYARLAGEFTAARFDAEALAGLAVRAGMRYVVFTTMHHDGFRLYDTALSNHSTMRTAARRDLVAELLAACRRRGLRVGLYHSLNNWHDKPDAVDALESAAARSQFLADTFARLRELNLKYRPFDVMWYDGWWPFNADGWEAVEMNRFIRELQPAILFNGRNGLPGDFGTPEGHVTAPSPWRPWEACLTLNNNWGFHAGDHDWKSPAQVLDLLARVAALRGNLLLNIGPRGDGSVPEESLRVLTTVGDWLRHHGEAVFDTDYFDFSLRDRQPADRAEWCHHGPLTAAGNRLYLWVRRWVPHRLALGGFECRVREVRLLGTAAPLRFTQTGGRVVVEGLPAAAPDPVCPVLRFDCDRPPVLYLCGGLRTPTVPHPHYDPCPSDIAH